MDKKFKIFVIIAIVILTVGIATVAFLLLSDNKINDKNHENVEKNVELPDIIEVPMGEEIMTNIDLGEDKVQHFVNVQISLGIDKKDDKAYKKLTESMELKAASIRNEFIDILGDQTYDMLSATDGKVKLADEIVIRLNKLLNTKLICEVYYQKYFVQ